MRATLVQDGKNDLPEVIRSVAAEPSVNGVGVFAAAGSNPVSDRFDAALTELSVPVFGGIFPEVLYQGKRTADAAVVIGLTVEPTVSIIPDLSGPEAAFDAHLPTGVPDDGTAFVLVDAYADRVEDFVAELFSKYGVDLSYLGGGVGSLNLKQQPCLFTDNGVREDAAAFVTLDTTTSLGVRHGWKDIAGPLRVTDADGPALAELNGEPAFSVYKQVVEEDAEVTLNADNFFEIAKRYPFGISRLDGETIVRDPFEVTDDGTLTCFGDIPEDAFLHVLKGEEDALIDAAGEAYAAVADARTEETAVLFFDCISRVLYLESAFERELNAIGDADHPDVGALTIGEIANDGEGHLEFYNKTAVVAVTESL